jgi:hypothetical protein
MDKTIAAHIEHLTIKIALYDPEHGNRKEAPESEFEQTKRVLRADGHYRCAVCGTTENLQVHHFLCEWSEWEDADPELIWRWAQVFDIYGYARKLGRAPIESPDDIRNMMVLCQPHHTGVDHADGGTGIGVHYVVTPVFMAQLIYKADRDPVPQRGETEAQAIARIKASIQHQGDV